MKHTEEIKQEAIRLRVEQRMGIKPIATTLGISRSTASLWLRDYPLTEEERRGKIIAAGKTKPPPPTGLDYVRLKGFDNVGLSLKKAWILYEQDETCNRCKLDEWMGEPIPLELEHKDGDTTNNSRENLECLCPNCHAQTPYYRSRNKATFKKKVADGELLDALRTKPNIRQALIHVGLTPRGKSYERANRLLQQLDR